MKMVRVIAVSCVVLSMMSAAHAQAPAAGEDAAVRKVVESEIDGWAKYDAAKVASVYAEDSTWQNPFGVRLHGRANLEKFLNNLFQRPGFRSAKDTSAPIITEVRMLSPTSAAVWSEEKSEGQIDDVTKKPMAPRYSIYLETLVKKDGAWFITDSIIMDEYPRR